MPWAGASRPWRPPKSCSDGVAQHAKDPVDDPFSKLSISLPQTQTCVCAGAGNPTLGATARTRANLKFSGHIKGLELGEHRWGLAPRTRPPGQTLQRAPAFAPAGELCRAKTIKT